MTEEIMRLGAPVVCLGEVMDSALPLVHSDDVAVGRMGAKHLGELGLQNLGYLGVSGVGCSDLREAGFCEEARAAGRSHSVFRLSGREEQLAAGGVAGRGILSWLRGLEKPCGVMAYYDIIAVRLMELCREAGIAVPGDVAVVGAGNDPVLCELSEPPLSSVEHDLVGIGYAGARRLDQLMSGDGADGAKFLVDPIGVVRRASTDASAAADPRMTKAMKLIEESACSGIGVADVVRAAGGAHRSFAALFYRVTGCRPKEAILRVKFRRVQSLLRTTDYKLTHIAEECGFEHMEHMAATFKRRFGVTPGQYRARYKSGGTAGRPSGDGHRDGSGKRNPKRRR